MVYLPIHLYALQSRAPTLSQPLATVPGFWSALRGISRRRDLPELLDAPDPDRALLDGNLRDLRLMNHWLRWSRNVARDVERLLPGRPEHAVVLDIATGSADIPRHIARRSAQQGRRVRAIATDISDAVLDAARRSCSRDELHFVRHDGAALPFRTGAADVVMCCLAAHHFEPLTLRQLLAEMWRVARRGIVVSDLYRSRHGYVASRGMALVLRNPMTSHDGPVSVLRAYTPAELRALAEAAGVAGITIRRSFPARMSLVASKRSLP